MRAVVEGMAFAVESLADDTQLGFVLNQPTSQSPSYPVISDAPLAFSRSMLHRLDVDWAAHGYDEAAVDELSEFCLRFLNSFLIAQSRQSRSGKELRRYLTHGSGRRSPTRNWRVRWTRSGWRRRWPDAAGALRRREPTGFIAMM